MTARANVKGKKLSYNEQTEKWEKEMKKSGRGTSDRIMEQIDKLSIDDLLRGLVEDSDLEEVVCCLDMIAKETGYYLELVSNKGIRKYPNLNKE